MLPHILLLSSSFHLSDFLLYLLPLFFFIWLGPLSLYCSSSHSLIIFYDGFHLFPYSLFLFLAKFLISLCQFSCIMLCSPRTHNIQVEINTHKEPSIQNEEKYIWSNIIDVIDRYLYKREMVGVFTFSPTSLR